MSATALATLLIPLAAMLPGLYYLYLHLTKDEKWAREKLHGFNGDEYQETENGAMAIDDENWIVYLYRR
jgi:hypothetical protein